MQRVVLEDNKSNELKKIYEHFEKEIKTEGIRKLAKQEDFYQDVGDQLVRTKQEIEQTRKDKKEREDKN